MARFLTNFVSRNPVVKFGPTKTMVGLQMSPEVALFSSRGPSSLSPSVLKVLFSGYRIMLLKSMEIDNAIFVKDKAYDMKHITLRLRWFLVISECNCSLIETI